MYKNRDKKIALSSPLSEYRYSQNNERMNSGSPLRFEELINTDQFDIREFDSDQFSYCNPQNDFARFHANFEPITFYTENQPILLYYPLYYRSEIKQCY